MATMENAAPRKGIRCRLGMHAFVTRVNDDGGRYLECERCGKEDFPPPTAGPRIGLL